MSIKKLKNYTCTIFFQKISSIKSFFFNILEFLLLGLSFVNFKVIVNILQK